MTDRKTTIEELDANLEGSVANSDLEVIADYIESERNKAKAELIDELLSIAPSWDDDDLIMYKESLGRRFSDSDVGKYIDYVSHEKRQTGRIKNICSDNRYAWIVYNCNDDWDNYTDYTGARTSVLDTENLRSER